MDDFDINYGYDDDEGMTIERVSDEEQRELDEISGIEGRYEDDIPENDGDMDIPAYSDDPTARSTPDNPLYDKDGNRIPYGFTRADWEKRKKAVAKNQEYIKERERLAREAAERWNETARELSEEEQLRQRQAAENDISMQHTLAGHGEDNIVDGDTIQGLSEEKRPDFWQYDFHYTTDPESKTITLNSYEGRDPAVFIPPVAYDEQGNEYKVRLNNDESVFDSRTVKYVGVSGEIPVEDFNSLARNQEEQARQYQAFTDLMNGVSDNTGASAEQLETSKPVTPKPEEAVPLSEQIRAAEERQSGNREPEYKEPEITAAEEKAAIDTAQARRNEAEQETLNQQETTTRAEEYREKVQEQRAQEAAQRAEQAQEYAQKPYNLTGQEGDTQKPYKESASYEGPSAAPVEAASRQTYEDLVSAKLQQEAVNRQAEIRQQEAVSEAARSSGGYGHGGNTPFAGTDAQTRTMLKEHALTGDGSQNFRDLEAEAGFTGGHISGMTESRLNTDNPAAKVYADGGMSRIGSPKAMFMAGTAGGFVAGSVVGDSSLPINGSTKGEYGSMSSHIKSMVAGAEAVSDVLGSDIGKKQATAQILRSNDVAVVSSIDQARRSALEAYVKETEKEITARLYGAKSGSDINIPIKEDLTELKRRQDEIKTKNIAYVDGMMSAFKTGVAVTMRGAGGVMGTNQGDSMALVNKARRASADAQFVFGSVFWRMAAGLESVTNAYNAELLQKVAETKGLSEADLSLTSTKGLHGKELKDAKIKLKAEQDALKEKLKKLGFSEKEQKEMIKARFRNAAIDGLRTQKELVNLSRRNPNMFTKDQLKHITSADFFNASKTGELAGIMAKYYSMSDNQYLAGVDAKRAQSVSFMSKLGKDPGATKSMTDAHKSSVNFMNGMNKASAAKKNATKGTKNPLKIAGRFLIRIDSDATLFLGKTIAYVRTGERMLGLAGKTVSFAANRIGLSKFAQERMQAAKTFLSNTKPVKKANQSIKTVKEGLNSVKASVGSTKPGRALKKAKKKVNGTKKAKKAIKKAVWNQIKATKLGALLVKLGSLISEIAGFLATVGFYILIGILIFIGVLLYLHWIAILFRAAAMIILQTEQNVITTNPEYLQQEAAALMVEDEGRYQTALKKAQEPPTGKAWDGSTIYHYGHYEDKYGNTTPYPNSTRKRDIACYYHDPDGALKTNQIENGAHIIYLDKDGNTIGSNTSNVKDVLSLSTIYTTNYVGGQGEKNDGVSAKSIADMNGKLYSILNPEITYIESDLYACDDGCDTYPKHGNYMNNSILYAYECNNPSIYNEYNRLKSLGVKFYEDKTFTKHGYEDETEYPERLVPQTSQGCNVKAELDTNWVIRDPERAKDEYEEPYEDWWGNLRWRRVTEYLYDDDGYALYDPKGILGVKYTYTCNGRTKNYERDYGLTFGDYDAYVKNGRAFGSSYRYSDDYPGSKRWDGRESWERAGFNTHAMYSYMGAAEDTPHAAIKACYGHRDLNIYITVLTKDDFMAAKGEEIEYKVPKKFDAKTGLVTEWQTKKTESFNRYVQSKTKLKKITAEFFLNSGFNNIQNVTWVNSIYNQDWYELYGINLYTEAAIPDTLTRTGQERLKASDLADVSEFRKTFVNQAYRYVGRIPYYYGGKAVSLNFSSNNFGSTVPADGKGRTQRGLDCSGFVHFVYCQVTDTPLREVSSSTANFTKSLGLQRIPYSELQPGDIGLMDLPGSGNNHIGIYAGNGMWIHCTGQPTNNVVYKNTNIFRYYYKIA